MEMNTFKQEAILGMVDMGRSPGTFPGVLASDLSAPVVAGQFVKLVDQAGPGLRFEDCDADTDHAFGVVVYDAKDGSRDKDEAVEVAGNGDVVFLRATGAIGAGVQVALDTSEIGGVTATLSAVAIVGLALDKAAADGDLIRVKLTTDIQAVGS